MTLLRKPTDWKSAKSELSKPTFLPSLRTYDKDNIDNGLLRKIAKYTSKDGFTYDEVKSKQICFYIIVKLNKKNTTRPNFWIVDIL